MSQGPALTTDCAAFDPHGRVLLIRRRHAPYKGAYALSGGFVEAGETVEDACRREFKEETGLDAAPLHLIGVYSDPGRDPRGPTVSIAYLTLLAMVEPQAGSDAAAVQWVADWRKQSLAFDHALILDHAEALRTRLSDAEGG